MITKKYITFFEELEKNNQKEWFHANKKRYENDVKKPFMALLDMLIDEIQLFDKSITLNAKETLFRINKDLRFSKDKTPYNTMMKAEIAPGGKKSILPGYYLGMSATKIHVGGGLFNLNSDSLKKIRSKIASNPEVFTDILNQKKFNEYFGELKGERAKRLDKAFQETLNQTPYIANKQFYAMEELPIQKYVDTDQIIPHIIDRFKAIYSLNHYLKEALL